VRNWCKQAEHEEHPAVCFDAWANDFSKEPLIGFIASLDAALKPHYAKVPAAQKLRRELLAAAKQIVMPVTKVVGAAASKKVLGLTMDQVADLFDGDNGDDHTKHEGGAVSKEDFQKIGKDLSKAMEDALKAHQSTARAIQAFKDKFGLLIAALRKEANVQLPVYVFVDELDRCRPDYAIALLEGIKHLFGIPGLYFVIATNIEQLAHSIKAVYGESFDAVRYLKRFFDMEFTLPIPDTTKFAIELLSKIIAPDPQHQVWGFNQVLPQFPLPAEEWLPYTFVRYARAFRLELRDMQQAAHILEACFLTMKSQQIHMHWLIFLVVLYQRDTTLYHQAVKQKQILPDLVSKLDTNNDLQFVVPAHQMGWENPPTKNVNILTVIEPFFSALRGNVVESKHDVSHTFPDNLGGSIKRALHDGAIHSYTELVPRAGRFT
jgi:hypothetical protein